MKCEESFITMKLIWHGYLVLSLAICVHKIPTETGLINCLPPYGMWRSQKQVCTDGTATSRLELGAHERRSFFAFGFLVPFSR